MKLKITGWRSISVRLCVKIAFSNDRTIGVFRSSLFLCPVCVSVVHLLESERTTLLPWDFILSWDVYGPSPASGTFPTHRGRWEILQKLAILTWFGRSTQRGLELLSISVCKVGRLLPFPAEHFKYQSDGGFISCSQAPVGLFGLSLVLRFAYFIFFVFI